MTPLNRIAARVLDKLISLVSEFNPAEKEVVEPPLVWKYTIADYVDGSPYLTRVLFPRIPVLRFRPMLHKFHRPDGDRALHNHPWKWAASLVLAGSYVEERLTSPESERYGRSRTETRVVNRTNFLTDQDFHRIVELRGEVYTLFVTGPRTQEWGFIKENSDRVIPWRKYIDGQLIGRARAGKLDEWGAKLGVERASFPLGDHYQIERDGDYRQRILAVFWGHAVLAPG